jgi:hypothetical protein
MATFSPNAIRADIETQINRLFNPPPFDTGLSYEPFTAVVQSGKVYINPAAHLAGDFDPSVWVDLGVACPVLFQNVIQTIPEGGAVRVVISWGATSNPTIPCSDTEGSNAEIEGVLTLFAYTPANEGTKKGLELMTRVRDIIPVWAKLPDLISGTDRPCYRITQPSGPRSAGTESTTDFATHNLTATLTAYSSGSRFA